MYRIISGRWKAKKIAAPKNFDVRPTTDFAKEALFSILENKTTTSFGGSLLRILSFVNKFLLNLD